MFVVFLSLQVGLGLAVVAEGVVTQVGVVELCIEVGFAEFEA